MQEIRECEKQECFWRCWAPWRCQSRLGITRYWERFASRRRTERRRRQVGGWKVCGIREGIEGVEEAAAATRRAPDIRARGGLRVRGADDQRRTTCGADLAHFTGEGSPGAIP